MARGNLSEILWQPAGRVQRVSFSLIGIAAWLTLVFCLISGWMPKIVLGICIGVIGILGAIQVVMTTARPARSYNADDE